MNKKLKLALAALLGFSSACSSVKNAPANGEGAATDGPDTINIERPIRVMYGVRMPEPTITVPESEKAAAALADTLKVTALDSVIVRGWMVDSLEPRPVVMYGVRRPDPKPHELKEVRMTDSVPSSEAVKPSGK